MPKPSPVDQIIQMRAQGLSNNQIVQQLQQQGYVPHEIFEGLNMAEMRQNYSQPSPLPPMGPPQNPMQMQPQSVVSPMGPPPGMPPMPGMQPMAPPGEPQQEEDVEALIEAVIEEKWGELKRTVEKISAWKEKTEEKMAQMEQSFEDLRREYDKLHQAVIGKVGDYDKNILEVGAQLQAMEKVFSKVLPTFTENVNELTRITEKLKK